MRFVENRSQGSLQWKVYQQLELIPETIPDPARQSNPLVSGLNSFLWRPLLALLMEELILEQQMEYLERCWFLNQLDEQQQPLAHSLQRFWSLIN